MLKAVWDNIKGFYSLLVGLGVTARYGLGPFPAWLGLASPGYPQLTTHYPRQTIGDEDLVTFRGPVELLPAADDPTVSLCVSCLMCVRSCPGGCLTVVKGQDKGQDKAPKEFLCDFSLCSLCGACVEVCPSGALGFSHDIYWVTEKREDLVRDLLAPLAQNGKERVAA